MYKRLSSSLLLLFILTMPSFAQTEPETGYRAEFLMQMDDISSRFTQLAGAFPDDSYDWRPAEGVRSVSEVLMHIADTNYFLARFIGAPTPADFRPGMYEETYKTKEEVLRELRASYGHLRSAVLDIRDADADQPVEMFGRTMTYRSTLLFMTRHMSEHLGQLIAYARMNKVAPPWSEG